MLYVAVSGPVIPIADVRGVNSSIYTKGERILRCKLAAVYRMMDIRGWTDNIYNHITVSYSWDQSVFNGDILCTGGLSSQRPCNLVVRITEPSHYNKSLAFPSLPNFSHSKNYLLDMCLRVHGACPRVALDTNEQCSFLSENCYCVDER